MYLSPVKKQWYMFGGWNVPDPGCDPVWHVYASFGEHWHCVPSLDYQIDMMKFWNVTKMARLLRANCTWFWADQSWISRSSVNELAF
jgi:hypothetical protein